jgi:Uma2 family endonuclease
MRTNILPLAMEVVIMIKKRDLLREDNVTYDDYASFDDGNRYELVDGHLEIMSPGPNSIHQCISFEIQKRITQTCEKDAIILYAPIDVILSAREVRQPDLIILLRTHLRLLSKRGIEGAPDIVVEILSPSTAKRDKMSKMTTYAKHGIPEYWIVDPSNGYLELYQLEKDRYTLANIFAEKDSVSSRILHCVSFTMQEIMDSLPDVLK